MVAVSENEVTTETVMSEVPTEMDSSLSELSQTKVSAYNITVLLGAG